jgi:hypothetical protein
MTQKTILFLLTALLLSASSFAQTAPTQQAKINIIVDREAIRFAPQELAQELRLVVTDQSGAELYDSGPLSVSTLDWLMRDSKGEAVKGGLYLYTLTIKDTAGELSQRRGYLIVNRAGDADRVYVATSEKIGIGASGDGAQLTVVGDGKETVADAQVQSTASRTVETREGIQRDAQGRSLAEQTEPAQKNSAGGLGPPIKTNIPDDLVVNGNLIFTPAPARDITMQNNNFGLRFYGAPTLTNSPAAAAIQFWGNNSNFPGQLYLDAGATDLGALIIRTAPTGGTIAERLRVTAGGNVGIGTPIPAAKLHVAGGDILFENKWRTETTTVNSPPVPGPPNLIGGFLGTGSGGAMPGNRVTAGVVGATIGGGGFNGTITFPSFGTLSADVSNRVTDWFGTVGGGWQNRAGNDDATPDNVYAATVGGGQHNTASNIFATVGGGLNNTAEASSATVGGGQNNTATGQQSTVGGGASNWASGNYATVGGGFGNPASGNFAATMGGENNTASGARATVGGGRLNTAAGDYSFAAGRRAKANHHGAFVWADSTDVDFASTANNQFLIRAAGGVGIDTAPTAKLHIAANAGQILIGHAGCDPGYTGIGFAASLAGCNNYSLLGNGTDTIINRPSGGALAFREGNTDQMTIAAGGLVTISGLVTINSLYSFNNVCTNEFKQLVSCGTSSLRYKTDIMPFTGGLEVVKRLRPISFTWKQGGTRDIGFGAEEVAQVEPLFTFSNDKGEIEGVKYDRVGVVLVNAVKEQQAQVEQQKAQITRLQQQKAALERHNAEQDARLRALEQQLRLLAGQATQRGNARASASHSLRR